MLQNTLLPLLFVVLTVIVEVSGDPALLGPGVHLGQVSAQGLAVGPGTRPGEGPDIQKND